jgi:hypothetical protein
VILADLTERNSDLFTYLSYLEDEVPVISTDVTGRTVTVHIAPPGFHRGGTGSRSETHPRAVPARLRHPELEVRYVTTRGARAVRLRP